MARPTAVPRNFATLQSLQVARGTTRRDSLYAALVALINEGMFSSGDALPSTRQLAEQLSLSRNTVISAYRRLVLDGLARSEERSVFRVSEMVRPRQMPKAGGPGALPPEPDKGKPGLPGSVSSLPRIHKDKNWRSAEYPFIYGQCDPATFPTANWRSVLRDLNSLNGISVWTREVYDEDDPELIDALRRVILPQQGLWAQDDEILITGGTQNALFMITRLLASGGQKAVVEDPGYTDMTSILRMNGAEVAFVPVDQEGLITEAIPAGSDLIYCTPERQFPTSVRMSLRRREALIERATREGFYVIEDGYDSELPFQGNILPCLRAMAPGERMIHVGSFSKTLAPGLRAGYVVASREIIAELRLLRRLIMRNPSTYIQAAIGRFIRSGYYNAHLQKLRSTYHGRYKALTTTLRHLLPDAGFLPVRGGTSVWLTLPEGIRAAPLYENLLARGVFVENGDAFFVAPPERSCLRLGYSSIRAQLIPRGVEIIAEEVSALRK